MVIEGRTKYIKVISRKRTILYRLIRYKTYKRAQPYHGIQDLFVDVVGKS